MIACLTPTHNALQFVKPWRDVSTSESEVEQIQLQVARDPAASVELHPRLVSAGQANGAPPVFACRFPSGRDQAERLALVQEKRVRLPLVKGFPWRPELTGIRLLGSRVLGAADGSDVTPIVDGFLELLDGTHAKYDCLLCEALETDQPLWESLLARSHGRKSRCVLLEPPQTHWKLKFAAKGDEYWRTFSSKTRYNFRRTSRRLPHDWQVIERAEQVESFLVSAGEISKRSWQGKRIGPRVREDDGTLNFHETLAELGALRSYLLWQHDRPIAFAIGTQWQGRFVLEEIGYDQQFAEFSPGTVLMLRMLEDMFERNTPDEFDFGFGDGNYKGLFGNVSTKSGNLLMVSHRLKPRLKMAVQQAGRRVENCIRAGLEASGIGTKLRQIYRR